MEATKNPAHSRRGFGVGYLQIAIARAEPDSPDGELFSTTGLRTKSWSCGDDDVQRRVCQRE